MTLNPRAGIVEAFDVSVLDAAGQLGITPGAVRQAIHAKHLSGIKRGGRFYVARRSLESYRVSSRGPTRGGGRSDGAH